MRVEFDTRRVFASWNRSILPVVVGERGAEHLHRRVVEPASEHPPVIGQQLGRAPVDPQRRR